MYYYITSDTEPLKTPRMTALNITKQMHIDGSSVLQNVNKCSLYFCKRKYCKNMNINCV